MKNIENDTQRTARLRNFKNKLAPANYTDNLYQAFLEKTAIWVDAKKIEILDRLYSILEKDFRRNDWVGKGYHCLEHSIECALLTQSVPLDPDLSSAADRLELAVAALLHDYDPLR